MSSIRRQSIISSGVVYLGFLIGMLNIYFFTKGGLFTGSEYGLTKFFYDTSILMMAFGTLSMPTYVIKFFPYYQDNLPKSKNDMLAIALGVTLIGFTIITIAGIVFKTLVIRKFSENSPEMVQYYEWIFPMGLGQCIFAVLEAYSWSIKRPVLTSFLKEVQFRLFTTLLILLFALRIIPDFDIFIKIYSLTYLAIALILFIYLLVRKEIYLSFSISKVTRRYARKILTLCAFVYSGSIVFYVSQIFDSLVIAAVLEDGMNKVAIFSIAFTLTGIIQAPQRAIVASSISHLSRAWKDRDMALLQKIYHRSSINLLIFASCMYFLMLLNYREAIITLGIQPEYLLGFSSFIFLGLTRVVDLGTGINTEIIGTSTYWRFQLISGAILLFLMLPLTYLLAKEFDILGPAIAQFISITIYNAIRIIFLWKKFRLFPFTRNSLYSVLIGLAAYILTYFAFRNLHGFAGLFCRSLLFLMLFGAAIVYLKLSPDLKPVVETVKKRLRL
ncbi:MAG: lipopolysaccharide biosynthesis protein [Chitinophagaceae bacterium]